MLFPKTDPGKCVSKRKIYVPFPPFPLILKCLDLWQNFFSR